MRNPSVAGQFYPSRERELRRQIQECFLHPVGPGRLPEGGEKEGRDIVGAVVPHAGYIYSGPEAAHVYYALSRQETPERIVLLGPNHTGMGSGVAVSRETWRTPLGDVDADHEAVEKLWRGCDIVDLDETAHRLEHSLEVQLPFLQYIYGEFRIVPICLAIQDLETSHELARCLADLEMRDVLFLASSDFTHYEPAEEARRKDMEAINHLLAMDERRFLQTVYNLDITACGYGAIATCLAAAKLHGATRAELLKYGNSGDITGDYSSVVAYSAILFRR
jgi:hypothetical protein